MILPQAWAEAVEDGLWTADALHPGSQLWNYIGELRKEGALKPVGALGPKLGCQFGITPRQMDRLWAIGQEAAAAPQPPSSRGRGKLSQAARSAWKVGIAESALFADICAAAEHLAQVESHRLGTQVDPLVTEEDMALRRAGMKEGRMIQSFYNVYVVGKRGEQLLLTAKAAAEGAGAGSAAGAARAQDPGTSAASAILVPDSP